ncbi:unnamed protein product [Nesidiocoris tenuis]|uniref:Uncharacterized protein n=1 Tax=Nesidiocoris tenuis TaxID=355587 RepID=A0A6H5FWL6_9HEMI|nr:unnamed protein product [Nesidiocoris tenuis]
MNKLQHLLEAANYRSDDQSLNLKNFIRYDDLSSTTDTSPYLKYPLKSKGLNNPDSFQDRTRSDLSIESEGSGYELIGLGERESKESCVSKEEKPRQVDEVQIKQKLLKQEKDVVYETPKLTEDRRKIGACIMKRINASITGCKTDDYCPMKNPIVPELVLKCTELFENETEDEEFEDSVDGSSCITSLEVGSMNRESTFSQRSYLNNNFCFSTRKNSSESGLLGVSEDSLNGVMLFNRESAGPNYPKSEHPDRQIVRTSEALSENATQTPAMSVHSFLEGLRAKLSNNMNNSGKIIVKKEQSRSSVEISRTRECLDLKTKNLEIQKTKVGLSAEIWTNQLSDEGDESPSAKNSLDPAGFQNTLNSIPEEFQSGESKLNCVENGLVACKSNQMITLKNEIIFENHTPTSTTSFSLIEDANDHRGVTMKKKGRRKSGKRSKKNRLTGTKSCRVM